jgi:hypothetical protein
MIAFTSDQWAILALVFVLGLLIGAFLFAGSGRKWKHRYRDEVRDREALEEQHRNRERDSLRAAAIKDKDRDGDGVPDRTEY